MSRLGIDVVRFIDAGERQIVECPSTKRAENLAVGDVVRVPGSELHDDLAGLVVNFDVGVVQREGNRVIFPDEDGYPIWFREGETVHLDGATYAEARFVA
jgi:hypothetical protein